MYYYIFKIFNNKKKISKGGFRKEKVIFIKFGKYYLVWKIKKNELIEKILNYKFDEFDKNKKRREIYVFSKLY